MRPILSVRLLAISLVFIALSTTGCDRASSTAPRESEEGELPTSRLDSGMDALYAGRLAGDEQNGCVWLVGSDGRLTVIWPQGFSVRWEPLRVYRPHGELLARKGDLIQMGGGRLGTGAWKRWASESVQHCRVSDDVWLANGIEGSKRTRSRSRD
jgi:hypothetical protein